MTKPGHPKPPQDPDPAFVMEADDSFRSILVSDGVRQSANPCSSIQYSKTLGAELVSPSCPA